MRKSILFLFIIVCSVAALGVSAQKQLTFKNGKLKIAQFTDIHWDHKSPNCATTTATIKAVLNAEKPDVAILTGDVITAKPAAEGWKTIIGIFDEAQVPFAVTMGNHDAEVLPKAEIYALLKQSTWFIGERGPEEIMGYGNYVLPVYGQDGKGTAKALLYCIDSNDYPPVDTYGHYDWVHFDQIGWYRNQSNQFTQANGGKALPALAFFHIALPEFDHVIKRGFTLGEMKEGGTGAPKINSGLFGSMVDMQDVMGVFVGHDHDNDFIGMEYGITLAYGRVSGTDAYGDFERGARIINLYEGKRQFDSWIRTPSGCEATFYFPSGLTSKDEESMTYLPALKATPKKQGVSYTYYEGKFKHTDHIASAPKLKEGTMKNISILEAPAKDHFAYDFRTRILIPEKGVYNFYTFSDDGSKLFIDGQVVVDNDGSHNTRRAGGKVALEAGLHELRVLYFEDYMGETLEVSIAGRNIPEMPVPDTMLYLPE